MNLLTKLHLLSPKVRGFVNIWVCVQIRSHPLITCTTFLYEMEGNRVGIIIQRWSLYISVGKHRLIVTIYKGGLLTRNAKHPYLVMKSSDIFNSLLHCNKIASKGTCFTWGLLLGHPINWIFIKEHNESSSQSSGNWVSRVIAIHIYSHPDSQSSRPRKICCYLFFDTSVNSWRPVLTFEFFVGNRRFTWIEYHLSIVMFLDIAKHVENLFKVAPPG